MDVPAPPPIEAGASGAQSLRWRQEGRARRARGIAVTAGPVMMADAHAPGYAVVGGAETMASRGCSWLCGRERDTAWWRPGTDWRFPVVDGGPRRSADGGDGPAAGAPGSYDPSVTPTSIPPAQVAMQGPGHDRPHIISHLLGLPKFGQIRRDREQKERDKHAAIAYGDQGAKVTELPASMVYGKDGH